jgi:ElaA protein
VIAWKCAPFGELSALEVHDILQARAAVFVVEQACAFQDVDGADPQCWHLLGRARSPSPLGGEACPGELLAGGRGEGSGALLAYCRLVPPGVKFAEPSIGRVLTTEAARRTGAGRELMREAVARAHALWPGAALRIGAQMYLDRFYGEFGFVKCSEPYDEDGIMHIEMLREATRG